PSLPPILRIGAAFVCQNVTGQIASRFLLTTALLESFPLADKPGLVAPCAFPSSDRTGQSTSLLVSGSPYCWGNDSHPPPSALYKATRFVVTAVWLCAKTSSFP